MKTYNVMAEVTIALTVKITAADGGGAQVAAKQYLERVSEDLSSDIFNPETDEITIEIGSAEEVK